MTEVRMRSTHSCKMPLFRFRWKHKVYVCDCGVMWRAVSRVSAPLSEAPIIWHEWVKVES